MCRPGLSPIVAKLLEKDRARRYQSAVEVRVDLAHLAQRRRTRRGPVRASSIVVLPFGNLSPDPENEFFADGLTEEVIADLSGIRALRVISRTSAMRFKGTDKDLRTIARELNVRYVLEGSVRRAGIEPARHRAAHRGRHRLARVGREVLGQHRGRVRDRGGNLAEDREGAAGQADRHRIARGGRAAHRQPGRLRLLPAGAPRDVPSSRRNRWIAPRSWRTPGLALIGENPLLLATRGLVSWYCLNFSIRPEERYLDEAASFATRALDQDPESFLGSSCVGLVAAKRGDIEGAVRDMRRACELKPGDAAVRSSWRATSSARARSTAS